MDHAAVAPRPAPPTTPTSGRPGVSLAEVRATLAFEAERNLPAPARGKAAPR